MIYSYSILSLERNTFIRSFVSLNKLVEGLYVRYVIDSGLFCLREVLRIQLLTTY